MVADGRAFAGAGAPGCAPATPLCEPVAKPARSVVVIGASAGGVESLRQVVSRIAPGFQSAILVAVHMSPQHPSLLPQVLSRFGLVSAHHPEDWELLRPGHIYVAKPGHDLMVDGSHARLKTSRPGSRFSPSIDALFQSAAYHFGRRATAVVLSGALDDGRPGVVSIKRAGGVVIVQAPEDAAFSAMPLAALGEVQVDHVVPARDIGPLLGGLASAFDQPARTFSVLADETAAPGLALQAVPCTGLVHLDADLCAFTCDVCRPVLGWLMAREPQGGAQPGSEARVTSSSLVQPQQAQAAEPDRPSELDVAEHAVMLAQHLAAHAQEQRRPDLAGRLRVVEHDLSERCDALRRSHGTSRASSPR